MKPHSCGPLAIAAFAVICALGAHAFAQNAYITNYHDNTVSVISTASNTVTATIPVGFAPFGVAVTSDGSEVYVANTGDNTVSVIDTASNTVTATIPVGTLPVGVAVTPDGSKVYVADDASDTVSVIDTASNTVAATIPVGTGPIGVAITPDGSTAYVTNRDADTVSVIDTASNTVITGPTFPISVGVQPYGVAVTPDGSAVYVADSGGASQASRFSYVQVIATANNRVTASIPVGPVPVGELGGPGPAGVAITPDGSKVYVTGVRLNVVFVISTASNTVTATIPVGTLPYGVAVTSDGSKVYVANLLSNTVSVTDTASNTVAATIPAPAGPVAFGVFIQPAARFAGTPGTPNCHGKSVSALAGQYGGLSAAAAALGYSSVHVLQEAIAAYCSG